MFSFAFVCVAFFLTLLLTPVLIRVAKKFGVLDVPGVEERKKHRKATPLLGGVVLIVVIGFLYAALLHWHLLPQGLVTRESVVGLLLGACVLLVGGVLDDVLNLPPYKQLIFTTVAMAIAVLFGISLSQIRSPFGGNIALVAQTFSFTLSGHTFSLIFPGAIFAFLWLLGVTYTTKVLDGLDGLVSGMTIIALVFTILMALRPELHQSDVVLLACVAVGAYAGFLVWNAPPARIFLGEAGSTFSGFLIGSMAVISGTKVATTLLVLGVPIIDLLLVMWGRVRDKRRVTGGDTRHLHFRLRESGLSERNTVLILYAFSLAFGSVGLLASTMAKVVAFLVLVFVVLLLSRYLEKRTHVHPV